MARAVTGSPRDARGGRRLRVGSAALTLTLVAQASACAKRTDERVRSAFGESSQAPGEAGPGRDNERGGAQDETAGEPVLVGWPRLEQILDGAEAEASLGTDDEVFARLAERWCETVPEPVSTEEGPVLVCLPDPPVRVEGHAFTLELGGEGVIGLVADELSAEASASLVAAALERLERWCTPSWTDVSPRPTEPDSPPSAELHTCPMHGSALLVVGRFVSDAEAEHWQVSVAVIDAS